MAFCVLVYIGQINNEALAKITKMSGLYTVQRIIGKRIRKGIAEYKVMWLGYSEDDCTWQPLKNLKYVEDMINTYEQEHGDEYQQQNQPDKDRKTDNMPLKKNQQENDIFEQSESEDADLEKNEQNYFADGYKFQEETNNKCFQEAEQDKMYGDGQECKEDKLNEQVLNYDISVGSLQFEEDVNLEQQKEIGYPALRKIQKTQQKNIKLKPENTRKQQNSVETTKRCFQQRISEQAKKSQLQQIQQKMRFKVKAPLQKASKQLMQGRKLEQLIVMQISRCSRTMELIYLTQQGPVISYKSQSDMKKYYPDELIKFYESRIEFAQIPKIFR